MPDLDPDRARRDAQQVLEGDRYRAQEVPRPLRGVLRWLGDRLESLGEPLFDLLATPAGAISAFVVLTGLTLLGVSYTVRRRNLTATRRTEGSTGRAGADPDRLDRDAEAAEAAGELDRAVRLRFRAGVLRLETAEVVPERADATTGLLVAEVPSDRFPPLAGAFDQIAYGGRPATPLDVEDARTGWPRVHEDVRRVAFDAGRG